MAKREIRRKTVRTSMNAVTGELETTQLDKVQLAFERCTQVIEGKMQDLPNGDVHRLAEKLADWLVRMRPHTDGGDTDMTRGAA